MRSKIVNIFFDVEGWEMTPTIGNKTSRLIAAMSHIKETLDRYEVKAIFNVCGIVAEYAQELFRELAEEGHEIACHGYSHENFHYLHLNQLDDILQTANECIRRSVGYSPSGIRCPWLTYDSRMLSLFKKAGYRWMSNQHASHSDLVFHSHRYRGKLVNLLAYLDDKRKWRKYPKEPYEVGEIVEIPLMSSMDGEIIGELSPEQDIPVELSRFAISVLKKQFERSTLYFNLNFHAIVIGSANRMEVLEHMLQYILNNGGRFITAKETAERISMR